MLQLELVTLLVLLLAQGCMGLLPFKQVRRTFGAVHAAEGDGGSGAGAFVRMDEALNAGRETLPPAIIVANVDSLLTDYHFETLDEILFTVSQGQNLPVLILGEQDASTSLRQLLTPKILRARDHELPQSNLSKSKTASDPVACILFSPGIERSSVSAAISGIRSWDAPSGGRFPRRIAFAIAVPNALDKRIDQLVAEITNDYEEQRRAERAA